MNRENRRLEWSARTADYKASGLTMSAWCTANHCSKEQLKYWLRKMKDVTSPALPNPSKRFVPVILNDPETPPVSTSSLIVRVGQASIEIREGFNSPLLREVIKALEMPC